MSVGFEEEEEVPVKRRRGRPPTTGKFVGIREKREAEREEKKEMEVEKSPGGTHFRCAQKK